MDGPVVAPFRPTISPHGMVVAGESLAASAGLIALAAGGHAADAALAMAAVTIVTMPEMCGLGGDAFALVFSAGEHRVTAFNGSGAAPAAARVARYRNAGYERMPLTGWWSVAVPGAVGVYFDLHQRFGRLPLADLWAPALRYARDGFPISARLAESIRLEARRLRSDPGTNDLYLRGGEPRQEGEVLCDPALAATMELLLKEGPGAFYRGSIASRIAAACNAAGGLLGAHDLARHRTVIDEPLTTTYRNYRVHTTGPPSQGIILLEALNLAEGFDLGSGDPLGADTVHVLVEATRLAIADRNAFLGDPAFVDTPVTQMLSKEYAARRRSAIRLDRAHPTPSAPSVLSDTTSFVAVDADGNAVSFIHSLSHRFGAAVIAGDTGVTMNNRAGRGFMLDEAHPNGLAPRKRTMHTLHPYMVTRDVDGADGELVLVGNTPGGDGQPQWNLQVISGILDFQQDVAAAVAAPRWLSWPGTDPTSLAVPQELQVESRFPEPTNADLRRRGHNLRVVGPWACPCAVCLIRRREDGSWEGAADPRAEGAALGV